MESDPNYCFRVMSHVVHKEKKCAIEIILTLKGKFQTLNINNNIGNFERTIVSAVQLEIRSKIISWPRSTVFDHNYQLKQNISSKF